MPFQLDTSGCVEIGESEAFVHYYEWPDLPPFVQGKLAAMFADEATQDALMDENGRVRFGFRHLSPAALERIMVDCERMLAAPVGNDPFFRDAPREDQPLINWLRQRGAEYAAGNAFWRFRAGDRDALFNAKIILITALPSLEKAARAFPPLTPYLGDDGKVYLR